MKKSLLLAMVPFMLLTGCKGKAVTDYYRTIAHKVTKSVSNATLYVDDAVYSFVFNYGGSDGSDVSEFAISIKNNGSKTLDLNFNESFFFSPKTSWKSDIVLTGTSVGKVTVAPNGGMGFISGHIYIPEIGSPEWEPVPGSSSDDRCLLNFRTLVNSVEIIASDFCPIRSPK